MLVKTLLEDKASKIVSVGPDSSISDAMELMIDRNIGCLVVLDADNKLCGIISDRDIFKAVHRTKGDYHRLKAGDIMTVAVIVGKPTDELSQIAWMMQKNYIRHIPIVDSATLVGLVSQRDILKYEIKTREMEYRQLQQHMDGVHMRDRSADV